VLGASDVFEPVRTGLLTIKYEIVNEMVRALVVAHHEMALDAGQRMRPAHSNLVRPWIVRSACGGVAGACGPPRKT
jgi:hypothetical protein